MTFDNLIDLHCHLLPHMDDGPRNLNQSLDLARAAVADGIRTAVLTSHYYEENSHGALTKRLKRFKQLEEALKEQGIPLEILQGFEVSASHALLRRRSLGALTLAGRNWILLERPYIRGDEFDNVAEAAFAQGLRPLVAHPERYPYFTTDFTVLERLVSQGAWVQLTAAAVAGAEGVEDQTWCLRALDMGLAQIVASDMHNVTHRPPMMQAAANIMANQLGEEKTREILQTNPERLLGRRL